MLNLPSIECGEIIKLSCVIRQTQYFPFSINNVKIIKKDENKLIVSG